MYVTWLVFVATCCWVVLLVGASLSCHFVSPCLSFMVLHQLVLLTLFMHHRFLHMHPQQTSLRSLMLAITRAFRIIDRGNGRESQQGILRV